MLALLKEGRLVMFPAKLSDEVIEDIKARIQSIRPWTITSDASVSLSMQAKDAINKMASQIVEK